MDERSLRLIHSVIWGGFFFVMGIWNTIVGTMLVTQGDFLQYRAVNESIGLSSDFMAWWGVIAGPLMTALGAWLLWRAARVRAERSVKA